MTDELVMRYDREIHEHRRAIESLRARRRQAQAERFEAAARIREESDDVIVPVLFVCAFCDDELISLPRLAQHYYIAHLRDLSTDELSDLNAYRQLQEEAT